MTMNHQLRKEGKKVAVLRSHPEDGGGGGGDDSSGGSGSGGGSDDPGYGKPSEDDIKKLGDLFNKS